MKILHNRGFPTPVPIDQNRHVVAMSRVPGIPMAQLRAGSLTSAAAKYYLEASLAILTGLAQHGLVHCDLNEFNLLISHPSIKVDNQVEKDLIMESTSAYEGGQLVLIDFPQMVSCDHENAAELFTRDRDGLLKFFGLKMNYVIDEDMVPDLMSARRCSTEIPSAYDEFLFDSTSSHRLKKKEKKVTGDDIVETNEDMNSSRITNDILISKVEDDNLLTYIQYLRNQNEQSYDELNSDHLEDEDISCNESDIEDSDSLLLSDSMIKEEDKNMLDIKDKDPKQSEVTKDNHNNNDISSVDDAGISGDEIESEELSVTKDCVDVREQVRRYVIHSICIMLYFHFR
jgi:RIO kinase 2